MRMNLFVIFCLIAFFPTLLFAQESTLSSGGEGTGSGGTFSFSFGQFAYNTYFESSSSVTQGVQHPFEIDVVSSQLSVFDTTIQSDDITCFNALQNITVAGGESFVIIQDGGTADFIAGGSIRFLPGFTAQSGSYVRAYITLDGNFCDGYVVASIVQALPEEKGAEIFEPEKENGDLLPEMQVKIYPNPNNGKFTINLINFENKARVNVYNVLGFLFYRSELEQINNIEISLPQMQKGFYFVHVTCNSKRFVKKIIVN